MAIAKFYLLGWGINVTSQEDLSLSWSLATMLKDLDDKSSGISAYLSLL